MSQILKVFQCIHSGVEKDVFHYAGNIFLSDSGTVHLGHELYQFPKRELYVYADEDDHSHQRPHWIRLLNFIIHYLVKRRVKNGFGN